LIRYLLGHQDPIVRANCAMALGCSGYNIEISTALSLSIKTDKNNSVRFCAVDALSSYKHKGATQELIFLAQEEGDFGIYCLKSLVNIMDDSDVLQLCRNILLHPMDAARVRVVLENIERANCAELIQEVIIFVRSRWWERDWDITRALISSIQTIANLTLAKTLEMIEKSDVVNTDLTSFIEQTKHELGVRFRPDIERDARDHKEARTSYGKNEGKLRSKYGFLIDEGHLRKILGTLYPPPVVKKKRRIKGKIKGQ
jgi:hypothetical protein